MSDLVKDLRRVFNDEDARYGYVEAHQNAFIATQIKELRGDMSQQELAEKLGTKQSGVSRLENANYSSWKVETLRNLARAFGVRLRISFEEFGTLVSEIESLKRRLRPRNFVNDPVFGAQQEIAAKSIEACGSIVKTGATAARMIVQLSISVNGSPRPMPFEKRPKRERRIGRRNPHIASRAACGDKFVGSLPQVA